MKLCGVQSQSKMRLLLSVVLAVVLASVSVSADNLSTNASEGRQTVTVDEGTGTSLANTKGMTQK